MNCDELSRTVIKCHKNNIKKEKNCYELSQIVMICHDNSDDNERGGSIDGRDM